ncbi:hypothetical protein [Herbiconiux solani]|uniref:hypothetical protein n=1 Tax=Herbiconiux solani TaxID=661329 RepID=UPI0008271506|nr:hypothetical protein [Herbiconiux solani]
MIDRETIIRKRYPLIDDGHGGQERDRGANPDILPIPGCDVQPGATQEDLQNRDGALVQWTVFAPGHPDVTATDDIEYQGETYAVDGKPARWPGSPAVKHTVILLKTWEG